MTEKSKKYFNDVIMPLILEKHSDILHEMSFIIYGSVGLGIDDEFSDVEAIIYLPDEIWKQNGLLQINLDKCLLETNLWKQSGSIICVHPLSWLLDGQCEKILAGGDVDWDKIQFDSQYGLFVIHNQPIWHDPQDRLGKLRRMTAPSEMPDIFWKKALLSKISNFVGGTHDMRRCADRRHFLDVYIPFGDAVKALLEIGFLICRQYYPYCKHLSWAFSRLPSPVSDLSSYFDLLSASLDWQERFSIMESIYNFYRNYIISNSLLPELDFNRVDLHEMPLHDNEFNIVRHILDNQKSRAAWKNEQDALTERTLKLGLEPEASRWVGWWEMG
jgi:hypothetical protein